MEERVQEVRERRQRQSMLEIEQHAMELRPLTHAFVVLSKRNSNWWMGSEVDQQLAAKNSVDKAATANRSAAPQQSLNASSLTLLGNASVKGGGPATAAHRPQSASSRRSVTNTSVTTNTHASHLARGGNTSTGSNASSGAHQTLVNLRHQWAHNYGDEGGGGGGVTDSSSPPYSLESTQRNINQQTLRARPQSAGSSRHTSQFSSPAAPHLGSTQSSSAAAMGGTLRDGKGGKGSRAMPQNNGQQNNPMAVAAHGKQRTVNPAFDPKTADAIQLGLALAERQRQDALRFEEEERRRRLDDNLIRRYGVEEAAARRLSASPNPTTTQITFTNNNTNANATTGGGAKRPPSSSNGSVAGGDVSTTSGRIGGAASRGDCVLRPDPFKAPPVPGLVDDPTAWLRQWQRQSEEKHKMLALGERKGGGVRSKLAEEQRRAAALLGGRQDASSSLHHHLSSNDATVGDTNNSAHIAAASHSIGADITVPDTVVWENNIPKGWFFYDKKEKLVCRRKVDTKSVQMAMLDGAKYENDIVAVLYVMGQSTLGGASHPPAHNNGTNSSSSSSNKPSSGKDASHITATSAFNQSKTRRDSAAAAALQDQMRRRRSSTMNFDSSRFNSSLLPHHEGAETEDGRKVDELNEEEYEEYCRQEEARRLKAKRYLQRAEAELIEDVQSKVLHCRFITAADLPSFLFDVGGKYREKGTCILQKFVYSVDVAHLDIFQAVWTPAATHVTRRQNVNNLFDERIPVFQRCTTIEGTGAEHYTQSVQITSRTQQQVKDMCEAFAAHFKETNPRHVLTRMICHFRLAGTLQGNENDHRLVFLFCSSARVMPADTKDYNRLFAKFRVALDVDVPIIVDEGEVAQAQSRLIALGTGPDGRPVNADDPYADVTSSAVSANIGREKHSMLHERYHKVSADAQAQRARDPYKTTNMHNAAFTQSVMVAATGANAAGSSIADPTDNTNGGAMLQSFLEANRRRGGEGSSDNNAPLLRSLSPARGGGKSLEQSASALARSSPPRTTSSSSARSRHHTDSKHAAAGVNNAAANVLYDSLFPSSSPASGAGGHTASLANFTAFSTAAASPSRAVHGNNSRVGSPLLGASSTRRRPSLQRGVGGDGEGERCPVTVKAVMEHVVTTENYLRGAISANAATGGKGYQRVGEDPVVVNSQGRIERSSSMRSSRSSGTNRSLLAGGGSSLLRRNTALMAARAATMTHAETPDSPMDSPRAGSPLSPRGGGGGKGHVSLAVPKPKMLVGMNPAGTRNVVKTVLDQVGVKECRAAYLDTIPDRHLTDAEKAELICLKLSALMMGEGEGRGDSDNNKGQRQQKPSLMTKSVGEALDKGKEAASDGLVADRILSEEDEEDDSCEGSSDDEDAKPSSAAAATPISKPTNLLKASLVEACRDHLFAIAYDCYGYYDAFRAALARDKVTKQQRQHANSGDALSAASSPAFSFYLSPSIETTFKGKAVPAESIIKVDPSFNSSDDDDDSAASDSSFSSLSDTEAATENKKKEMSVTDLLDKYRPKRRRRNVKKAMLMANDKKAISSGAVIGKDKVTIPPLCVPVEALFAVYLSRLSLIENRSWKKEAELAVSPANPNFSSSKHPPRPSSQQEQHNSVSQDAFLWDKNEDERVITAGDVDFEMIKLAEDEEDEHGNFIASTRRKRREEKAQKEAEEKERRRAQSLPSPMEIAPTATTAATADDENNMKEEEDHDVIRGRLRKELRTVVVRSHKKPSSARHFTDVLADLILCAVPKSADTNDAFPSKQAQQSENTATTTMPAEVVQNPLSSASPSPALTPAVASLTSSTSRTATVIIPPTNASRVSLPPSKTTKANTSCVMTITTTTPRRREVTTTTPRGGGGEKDDEHPFGLTTWLRQYYAWDKRALAEDDEVLEIQVHPAGMRNNDDEVEDDDETQQSGEDDGLRHSANNGSKRRAANRQRTREQLAILSRRMPQMLHHHILSFLDELRRELKSVDVF